MEYEYKRLLETFSKLRYLDMVQFSRGVAEDLFEKDDAVTIDKVVSSLLSTAGAILECEAEREADENA